MAVKGYRYFFGIHMGICRGPADELCEIRIGDRTAWVGGADISQSFEIDAYDLFGGEDGEGGVKGTFQLLMGAPDQVATLALATFAVNSSVIADPNSGALNPMELDFGPRSFATYVGNGWIQFMPDGTVRVNSPTSDTIGFAAAGRWHLNTPFNAADYEVQAEGGQWLPITGSPKITVDINTDGMNASNRYRSVTFIVRFRKGTVTSDNYVMTATYIY